MRTFIMAALAATAIATSAGALTTVTSNPGPDNTAGQTVLYNFNGAAPAGLTGNYSITTGTAAQLAAAPLGDMTNYLVVPGTTGQLPGSATLNLASALGNLSFYWGSIDSFNTVSFFSGANGTGTNLGTFGGTSIAGAPANGNQTDPANNRRVFFNFGGSTAQSIVFTSSQRAFELDDIATAAVPEPAIWATLLTGFGMVGFAMRRRNSATVSA